MCLIQIETETGRLQDDGAEKSRQERELREREKMFLLLIFILY